MYKRQIPYSEPIKPITSCIFPLTEVETKLWELKNRKRSEVISRQKYRLTDPIFSIKEYPFIETNMLVYKQSIRTTLSRGISHIKRYDFWKGLDLKKKYFDFEARWETDCSTMDAMSNELRSEEIEMKLKLKEEQELKEKKEKELEEEKNQTANRRRNRADFVDDDEMENVLLQIDPDYKHHQAAAIIPTQIINPLDKFTINFKDVNNLVTEKDKWASRILKDGVDTFTDNEHELFVDGYLMHPKKFGKISHHMGGLRTPEECVLHYYRTKKMVDYKSLLLEKNKKRKSTTAAKRRKKKGVLEENDSLLLDHDSDKEAVATAPEIRDDSTHRNDDTQEIVPVQNHVEETESPKKMEEIVVTKQSLLESRNILVQDPQLVHAPSATSQFSNDTINESDIEDEEKDATSPDFNDTVSDTHSKIVDDKTPHLTVDQSQIKEQEPIQPLGHDNSQSIENMDEINSHLDENGQKKKQKPNPDHKSSYWSVREAYAFPELLKEFGSQWSLISQKIGSKSTTMVRNYYQRNSAHFGWKLLVEDADNRRNAIRSGSVHQSQMLLQPEQMLPTLSSGIPPQQRPALHFFGNQSDLDHRYSQGAGTPTNPFHSEIGRDSFSVVTTPSTALPPPRLPSIQLQSHEPSFPLNVSQQQATNVPHMTPVPSSNVTNPLPTVTESGRTGSSTSAANVNSIQSILNADSKQSDSFHLPVFKPTEPALPSSNGDRVIIQGLSTLNHEPRTSSLSAILNPEVKQSTIHHPMTNMEVRRQITQPTGELPYQPLQTAIPSAMAPQGINFANDPLAALAAVASAPENMSSLLPNDNSNRGNAPPTSHN